MDEQPKKETFKDRVLNTIVDCSKQYQTTYVEQDHLIVSEAFKKNPYYIIEANGDNYLHLTGVSTSLSAADFYDKCIDGSLTADDFDLVTHNKSEKESKGVIRQKIRNLPLISSTIDDGCLVQEDFRRNSVLCTFASSAGKCTLGFIASPTNVRPKSLLNGSVVDAESSSPLKIRLTRARGEDKFSTLSVGTLDDLASHYNELKDMLSDDLIAKIESHLEQKSSDNPPSNNKQCE